MGNKVIFTVPLDPDDDVAVSTRDSRGSFARDLSSQLRISLGSPAWRLGALAVVGASAVGWIIALAVAEGWTRLAPLAGAVSALAVASAVLGAGVIDTVAEPGSPRSARMSTAAARSLAIALAAAAMAIGALPALVWLALGGEIGEAQVVPLVSAILASASVAGLAGTAVVALRRWENTTAVAALTGAALIVAPIAGFWVAVPLTARADELESLQFVAINVEQDGVTRPAFVCRTEYSTRLRSHPERVAWLLSASPLVAVADAPLYSIADYERPASGSVAAVQAVLRSLRTAPSNVVGFCYQPTSLGVPNAVREARIAQRSADAPPALVIALVASAAAALASVTRRLRS